MKFIFENKSFSPDQFDKIVTRDSRYSSMHRFIQEWLQEYDHFTFHTSGSTGTPKPIRVSRQQITASVISTQQALNLQPGKNLLICLNPDYVASLMMVARGLFLNMNIIIIPPTSDPLNRLNHEVHFASFVPFQIYQMIQSGSIQKISSIENILIGGAPLSPQAFQHLKQYPNDIYLTYGMTETVSHVALMKIEKRPLNTHYQILEGIQFGSVGGCLWVKGEITNHQTIQTRDMIEVINRNSFKWLGRQDNVINSGGVKIHPELIEQVIQKVFDSHEIHHAFYIIGIDDDSLGQKAILKIESVSPSPDIIELIKKDISVSFSKYHVPRAVKWVARFDRTTSGKIKRI